ncbi:unnamed protein product, partial [Mesorhabditis belari]|uniref:Uncharacterized protein n=1 Tax=Mesorhabditis belari TaxID=2138241 RepID=A0AAF3EQK9_9BILA
MTAPPLNPDYSNMSSFHQRIFGLNGPREPTNTQERHIEDLEMTTFRALQAQADMEYKLEVAEAQRKRLEQQQRQQQREQRVFQTSTQPFPLRGTFLVDRIVRQPAVRDNSPPVDEFCCTGNTLLKLFLFIVGLSMLGFGIFLIIHFCF